MTAAYGGSAVIEAAYAAAEAPQQWPQLLRLLAQLLDADHAALLVGTTQRPDAHVSTSTDGERPREYLRAFRAAGPLGRGEADPPEPAGGRRRRISPLLREFAPRRDDLYWSCGGHFEISADLRLTFAALRERSRGRFDELRRRAAGAVLPHVLRAAALGAELDALRRSCSRQARVIDLLLDAVIVIDADDRIVQLNARARGMLNGDAGESSFSARALKLAGAGERARLAEAIDAARSAQAAGAHLLSLRRAAPEPPFNVTVFGDPELPGCVHIFLRDPRWRTPPSIETLMSEFRLTYAQANVCLHVLRDERAEQIALALGIRVGTVRAQIKAVMQKAGVHRVAQLVHQLAVALPAAERWS